MINLNSNNYKKLLKLYSNNVEILADNLRVAFTKKGEKFSIFTTLSKLDNLVILHDDKDEAITRYYTYPGNEKRNYLILSAGRSIEQMRFDAACSLRRIIKKVATNKKGDVSINFSVKSKEFTREEKHFACALLMPRDELLKFLTRKKSNGKYLYFNDKNELSLRAINVVADHFGMPYNQCASRIFHVFDDLRKEGKANFTIEGCIDKKDFQLLRDNYSQEEREKDMYLNVYDHEENRVKLIEHLIDSLHYRSFDKLSEIAKRKLLISLVKADSVNEGVVRSEEEAKAIINNYLASNGTIYDGKLVTKDGESSLTDEQLVVLGEYELYNKTLQRGLIRGIAKSNPSLKYIEKLSYKEAIESINERDLTIYIRDLHTRLFSKLSYKYGEQRGGFFREGSVNLKGTNVSVPPASMVPQLMDNLSWRLLKILKDNADGKLTNSKYIDSVNECIYEMIRLQPFGDGNKRTARLLSNILYQEKGLPYVIVPVKDWDNYVDAWSSDNSNEYDKLMHRLILESYKYFYGDQSTNEAFINKTNKKTANIINDKRDR